VAEFMGSAPAVAPEPYLPARFNAAHNQANNQENPLQEKL
jgi:hypothetical protein